MTIIFISCNKDNEIDFTTISVINEKITPLSTSAIVQCNFETKATLRNVYVQYATIKDFSNYIKLEMTQENGIYTAILEGLEHTTSYYVRYFVSNNYSSAKIVEIRSFQTLPQSIPTIMTSSVTNIDYTTATIGGYVIDDGGANVMERGVVYSTSPSPTISDSKVVSDSNTKSFTCNLTDLQDGITYYTRAYAANKVGVAYGKEVSFTTIVIPVENGYEYVDLGLSVKWATMNVGANKPEDYGDYFAWGETITKTTYNWTNYKYCKGSFNNLTKYNTESGYGIVDNKTQLDLSDDVASASWGGRWRMPTDVEMIELRTACTWRWATQNGINGYIVTSNKEGFINKFIFLPAAGDCYNSVLSGVSKNGSYWSSSLSSTNYSTEPLGLFFNSGQVYRSSIHRCRGQSVRPVCP